jgi:hypothetical protein
VALFAPYHPESNALIERQNKSFLENLKSYVGTLHDDWDEHLISYEFAYNASVNPSTGECPFFLTHGRHPVLPVAIKHPTPSPAVDDFVLQLQNRIAAARDHIRLTQAVNADTRSKKLRPVQFKVGDKVLLSTEHYNLMLPSQKLAPRWIGPLTIEQIRGPNTVRIEVPPRLARIEPLQNVVHLKPYVSRPSNIGPTHVPDGPELVDGQEEFVVDDIITHRGAGRHIQYLVRFEGYGPEDDLWLPARNLDHAQEVLAAYHARQTDKTLTVAHPRRQRAQRQLRRLGHSWHYGGP